MKTIRFYIFCFQVILATTGLKAQVKTYLGEKSHISYAKFPGLDSIVYIDSSYSRDFPWIVYFDKQEKNIAFESHYKGDTIYENDYWRNGRLKQRKIMIRKDSIPPVWYFEETHCENGQVVSRFYLAQVDREVV